MQLSTLQLHYAACWYGKRNEAAERACLIFDRKLNNSFKSPTTSYSWKSTRKQETYLTTSQSIAMVSGNQGLTLIVIIAVNRAKYVIHNMLAGPFSKTFLSVGW